VIPTLRRLRQDDCDIEASLCYIVSSRPGLHFSEVSLIKYLHITIPPVSRLNNSLDH
jgi:hypothetical protein